MKRFVGMVLLAAGAVFVTPSVSHAQDVAAVTGIVSDSNGGAIVGADVSLVNTTTRAAYSAKTNGLGSYKIVNATPGPGYKLTFKMPGFGPVVVKDIYLTVATTRTQNVVLKPGPVTTEIEVSAADSEVTLNTTDATIGNNFDMKLMDELPVQVRDTPSALFSLQPGITTVPGSDGGSSVTGARTDQSYVSVDGLDVNDISTGQSFLIVANAPVDSVEEFKGTVAGETADSEPAGGGQFQLVTKGGSNNWHGSVNLYHRDTSTQANDWFRDEIGLPLPHYVRNQFGGNVSGPIKKDKAFFFFNFFDLRLATSTAEDVVVPTQSYASGNISYILANASNSSGPCSYTSRLNTTPQCIGTLTPAQVKALDPNNVGFSPVLQSFLSSRYPAPNDPTSGDGINTEGFRFAAPDPEDETNYVVKLDYNLSPTMKVFAKAGIERQNSVEFPQYLPSDPVYGNPFIDRSYNYVVGHTWTIGATKVNQFYYGDTVEKYDFPADYAPTGTTVLTFGGVALAPFLDSPYNEQETQKRRLPIPVVRDDFTWQKGSHNLAFGGSFKFIKTSSQQVLDFNFLSLGLGVDLPGLDPSVRPDAGNGYVTNSIRGGTTAPLLYDNAFALALGHISGVDTNYNYNHSGVAYPNGTGHFRRYRYYQTELYATDSWKASKSLTLTYGLRYQYYSVPYETNGYESIQNFDFDTYFADRVKQSSAGISGPTSVPFITYNLGGKANGAAPLFQPNYKDFAPRASFAYNPSWSKQTVFNGSAGIVFDRTVLNALNFVQDQSSYLFQNAVNNNNFGDLSADPRTGANFTFPGNTAPVITHPYTPNLDGYGGTDGLTTNAAFNTIINPNLKDPYSILLNAGMQQELPGNMVLKLNYVGRMGRRLLAQADGSQLIDFPDTNSGQLMSNAFAALTLASRAGQSTVANQPWLEDQVGPGFTQYIYADPNIASYIYNGDFADFIQYISPYLDYNVGMAAQFSENTFYTNKGSSSYNGMLVTLSKNMSHGLKFDVNYTWSHSIDNTSLIANAIASSTGVGFLCDAARPRECRGNSDFDQTHVLNANFLYDLPVGRGRAFAENTPRWLDSVIGGWAVSGIPQWHSGLAFTAFANAYVAGFANDAPAIFNGDRGAVAPHVHKLADGSVNLFADTNAADAAYSGPVGFNIGSRNNLRGPSAWTFDAGLAKTFPLVADRVDLKFRADAFNALNHPTFALPGSSATDITEESGVPFGQIDEMAVKPRVVQLAVRIEF